MCVWIRPPPLFLVFQNKVPLRLETEDAGPTTFVVQENGLLNSLAIVLTQEMIKFNRLIGRMNSSLRDVKLAIQGQTAARMNA